MVAKRQGDNLTLDEANELLIASRRSVERATDDGMAISQLTESSHLTTHPEVRDPQDILSWFIGVISSPPEDADGQPLFDDFNNAMYWVREVQVFGRGGVSPPERPELKILDEQYIRAELDRDVWRGRHVAAMNLAEVGFVDAASDRHSVPEDTVVRVMLTRSADDVPRYYFSHSAGGGAVTDFHLRAQMDDYLICSTLADNGTPNNDEVFVACPWMLRRTPFDGQARNGIDYGYTGPSSRVATLVSDEAQQEHQIIIPSYTPDFDIIHATRSAKMIRNLSGIEGTSAVDTNWIEVNQGRAWARRRTQ
jgi:hypothetical protein